MLQRGQVVQKMEFNICLKMEINNNSNEHSSMFSSISELQLTKQQHHDITDQQNQNQNHSRR